MNQIDTTQILSQIRSLNAELQAPPSEAPGPNGGFGDLFRNAITQVNEAQMQAGEMKREFAAGRSERNLAEVMIASQKADLSFRAMTEVRNKLITAYQEIMNMPV